MKVTGRRKTENGMRIQHVSLNEWDFNMLKFQVTLIIFAIVPIKQFENFNA